MKQLLLLTTYGIILLLVGILVLDKWFGTNAWEAIAALGTILAVIVAIFQRQILEYINRPKLEIDFQCQPPYFRDVHVPLNDDPEDSTRVAEYYVNIAIRNTGNAVALNCQPMLTGVWTFEGSEWVRERNWVSLGLRWALDEVAENANRKLTEERNLVPRKPYLFNLGKFRQMAPDIFTILPTVYPLAQTCVFFSGKKHRFDVTIYAENINKPIVRTFELDWNGRCTGYFEKDLEAIHISPPMELGSPYT